MRILFFLFFISLQVFSQNLKSIDIKKGISLQIPDNFNLMSDDDIAQKYPSYRKPLAVYSNSKKSVDIGVNYTINKWNNSNLSILKSMYKATISSVFTDVSFFQDGVIKKVNDRDFIVFEFISTLTEENGPNQGKSMRTYTYLAYTIFQKKVLVFNMNAEALERNNWAATFENVFGSIKISNKLELDAFTPFEAENKPVPKSSSTDTQLKLLKRLGKSRTKNPQ